MPELDLTALAAERARLRAAYLRTGATRTPTTARGCTMWHSSVRTWSGPSSFIKTSLSSPSPTSSRTVITRGRPFFFDIGHGNTIAFFDFPGLDLGAYQEVLGGLHHLALSMEPEQWERMKVKLEAAAVAYSRSDDHSTSVTPMAHAWSCSVIRLAR